MIISAFFGARNLKDWADLGELIDQGIEVHFANEGLDLHLRDVLMPSGEAARQSLSQNAKVLSGGVCLKKSELISSRIPSFARAERVVA